MIQYTKQAINNCVLRALCKGLSTAEACDIFISMMKANDKGKEKPIETYLEEWEDVLCTVSKRAKCYRMAELGIKAIFNDAMKEYPHITYDFLNQQRRVRIRVKLPNSRLGVFIYAWFGSYKQRLPQQIQDLKVLIDAHSQTNLKDFFISHR